MCLSRCQKAVSLLSAGALLLLSPHAALCEERAPSAWMLTEIRRFPAKEAFQGVAVDEAHFYAIGSKEIGKYRKDTGAPVARWEGESGGPVQHLNSGIVHGRELLVAHSNFPAVPEESSMEIFDPQTLQPLRRHVIENPPGSLTWIVPFREGWLACFAHYRRNSDPAKSRVVRFDADWKKVADWSFPAALVERFAGHSSSGGAVGPEGKLFVTGHDARELYVIAIPETPDGELVWEDTIPIGTAGQAFAWDPTEPGLLYSIERKTREVVVSKIQRAKP
ncbi:MAG TPA: cycloisomerase [Bacteroidia bacterium]|nr:cycloisomerase [Bacteroidia bacterium]